MLSKDLLQKSLSPIFQPDGMPRSDALSKWVQAYHSYALTAVAGGTFPVSLVPSVVQQGEFFSSLEASLSAMWMTCVWGGPGLTGTTIFVPPLLPNLISIGSRLITSSDPQLGLQLITEALHTYTLGVVVAVVAAGVSSPTPLT